MKPFQSTLPDVEKQLDRAQPKAASGVKRSRWVNTGTSPIEVAHGVFLQPGQTIYYRPIREEFYKAIGAITEVKDE